MICPQTKAECGLTECSSLGCVEMMCAPSNNYQPKTEFGKKLIDLRAKAVANGMPLEEPPPTLAEFERLVDVFGEAVQSLCHFDECGTGYGRPELEVGRDAARADLIDFARRMGVE